MSRAERKQLGWRERMRTRILLIWCLCALLVASGCWGAAGPEPRELEEGELPYPNPVVMRVGYPYSNIALPEGEISDQNFMSRYIKEKLGIIIRYDWEVTGEEQYNTMLELSIQSQDLPDVFTVNREQLLMLAERDLLADLTELYPRYSTSLLQSIYDATEGNALREATFDGKLLALPNVTIEADAPTFVWVRQDWMEKLDLSPPSTLADIEQIAKAFIEQDPDGNNVHDTVGIPIDKSLVFHKKTGIHGLDSVFAAFHAFPKSWLRTEEGYTVYGSIQAEAKAALELLARWYDEGILDREFMLRKESGYLIEENQVGILFAPWWAPYWPLSLSVSKDTKAEWAVYAAPKDVEGRFVTRMAPITNTYLVVRKDYDHPEAAMKLLHLLTELERHAGEEDEAKASIRAIARQMGVQLRNYYPLGLLLDDPDAVVRRHDVLLQALEGKVEETELNPEMQELYESIVSERDFPRKDMEAWSITQAYLLGGAVSKEPRIEVEPIFFDRTPAYDQYWPALQRLEQEYYLKILTGELPISAFDDFVAEWLEAGGTSVMREVAEWAERESK